MHFFHPGQAERQDGGGNTFSFKLATASPRPYPPAALAVFDAMTALTCFRVAAHPHVVVPDFHLLDALSELLEVHRQHDAVCFHVAVPEFGDETLVQDAGHLAVHGRVRYVGHVCGGGGGGGVGSVELGRDKNSATFRPRRFIRMRGCTRVTRKGKGVLPK